MQNDTNHKYSAIIGHRKSNRYQITHMLIRHPSDHMIFTLSYMTCKVYAINLMLQFPKPKCPNG